jgi:hypothetical protein
MSLTTGYLKNPPSLCGPYAIYNAKVWRGDTDLDIRELIIRCKTTIYHGTRSEDMFRVLDKEFNLTQRRCNDPRRIKQALDKGYGILLGYQAEHTDSH